MQHALVPLSGSTLSLHFFPSASAAALVAARHIVRRPFALRSVGPSSTRIHHDPLHHDMCPFDTSLSSHIRFLVYSSLHSPCALLPLSFFTFPLISCFSFLSFSRLPEPSSLLVPSLFSFLALPLHLRNALVVLLGLNLSLSLSPQLSPLSPVFLDLP